MREYSVTQVVCDADNLGDPKKELFDKYLRGFSVEFYVYGDHFGV